MFDQVYDLNFWSRVICAIGCGFCIGLERQIKGRPVGIRTSILICLGTMLFIYLGLVTVDRAEMARIIGQIITGIGFLGAGVIMTREGTVTGMTSAAEVWMLAGIGIAIGFGYFGMAIALSAIVLFILVGIQYLEDNIPLLHKGSHRDSSSRP